MSVATTARRGERKLLLRRATAVFTRLHLSHVAIVSSRLVAVSPLSTSVSVVAPRIKFIACGTPRGPRRNISRLAIFSLALSFTLARSTLLHQFVSSLNLGFLLGVIRAIAAWTGRFPNVDDCGGPRPRAGGLGGAERSVEPQIRLRDSAIARPRAGSVIAATWGLGPGSRPWIIDLKRHFWEVPGFALPCTKVFVGICAGFGEVFIGVGSIGCFLGPTLVTRGN